MRDPQRIPATLAAVQALWEQHPDMRLGQLIDSLAAHHYMDANPTHGMVRLIEDEALEAEARAVLERGWWKWRSVVDIAIEAAEQRRKAQEDGS